MKRTVKICLCLAGCLLTIGLVLSLAGAAMGGRAESDRYFSDWAKGIRWGALHIGSEGVHIGGDNGIHVDDDGISVGGRYGVHVGDDGIHMGGFHGNSGGFGAENRTTVQEDLAAFRELDVELGLADVTVRAGEGYAVDLQWDAGESYRMVYENRDGTLTVKSEGNVWLPGFCATAVITVPEGTVLEEMELSTALGDVRVEGGLSARSASLYTALGDVTSDGFTAGKLDAESDLGDVKLSLPGSREDYRWQLETDMGEITVDSQRQDGGLGTIACEGGSGKNSVDAATSLGNVEMCFSS